MNGERQLRRSELYALVWKQPLKTVAADIGVSDVAVGKACRRQKIPLPGLGYWRRKECGYKVKASPLPASPGRADPFITFHPKSTSPEQQVKVGPEQEFEARPENAIVVPDEVGKTNRFVRRTIAGLRRQRRGGAVLLAIQGVDCFRVSVSVANLDRVHRILQTLVSACEARGYELTPGEVGRSRLAVNVNGEPLEVAITEKTKAVPHVLTDEEEARGERFAWSPRYDAVPIGTLIMRVMNSPLRAQGAVRDRLHLPLEMRLNEVLAMMAVSARMLREEREAAEQQRKEWEEEARKAEESRKRLELEGARLRRIDELVERSMKQEALRAFLDVVRKRMEVARPELVPTAQAWVDWAETYLKKQHPADPLFFEPLIEHGTSAYWRYSTPRQPPWS